MPVVNGDILKLGLVHVTDGVSMANVLHLNVIDIGTAPNDLALFGELINDNIIPNFYQGPWFPANSANNVASCAKVQKVAPAPEAPTEFFYNIPGSEGGDSLPTNKAVLTIFNTDNLGPGGNGRAFWGAPPEPFVDEGRLNTLAEPLWVAVADFWTDSLSAGPFGSIFAPTILHGDLSDDLIVKAYPHTSIRQIKNRTPNLCPV